MAAWPNVGKVLGVDPSPGFIAKARELAAGTPNLSFEVGDGRSLESKDATFDVVVFHTVLGQMAEPEKGLAEAHRVLKSGGWLAVFDNDSITTSVSIGEHDPLQACIDARIAAAVNDKWLVRRLLGVLKETGFAPRPLRTHSLVETLEVDWMLTMVDRGAEALLAIGRIGSELAAALKAEARRRIRAGQFFGHNVYVSVVAQKLA